MTLRLAIVPPAPAAYREPLYETLHARADLRLRVIYQSAAQPSWDVAADWFATAHRYPSTHLRSRQRGRPGRTPIVWPRGLERALDDADPDCVIVSEYGLASLRALAWCRRHGRAHVILTECTSEIDGLLSRPQLALHRTLARLTDGVIAVSPAARDRLLSFGVSPDRITVAPQSVDAAPIRAAVAAAGPPPDPPPFVVLTAGRLVPDKNVATLIEAVARLTRDGAQIALRIAGTGFLADDLHALARARQAPVRFLGAVPASEMPALYAAAHAFALASTFEPYGVVVGEAVAAGLPIVCSRVAGAAGDVAVDGRNATLVDPDSVEQIAAALRRLHDDGALRSRMSDASCAIDAEHEGRDVAGFVEAARAATARRRRRRGRRSAHEST